MLNVDGLHFSHTSFNARFLEILAGTEFADSSSLFEFSLEFLKSFLYVLSVFYRYDNHSLNHPLFLWYSIPHLRKLDCKGRKIFLKVKFSEPIFKKRVEKMGVAVFFEGDDFFFAQGFLEAFDIGR